MNPYPFSSIADPLKQSALVQWGNEHAEFRLSERDGRSHWGPVVKGEVLQNTVQFAESIGATVEDLRSTLETSLQSQPSLQRSAILSEFWVDILKTRMEMRRGELEIFEAEKPDRAPASRSQAPQIQERDIVH